MAEAAEVVQPGTPKPGVVVVTNENFDEYVTDQLSKNAPETPQDDETDAGDADVARPDVETRGEPVAQPETPEKAAEAELAKVEAEKAAAAQPKEGDVDGNRVFFKGKWTGKNDFSYRMHLKTEEARAATERAARFEAKAKADAEALALAERQAADLRARYEPPISDELGPEPQAAQFKDVAEYSKALKEWTADATRREDAAKQAEAVAEQHREQVAKEWGERLTATQKEIPDYTDKISTSTVKISDQMRDAIVESEIGPKILYHLAENPEIADTLGKMTVGKMLRELGRLEAKLMGSAVSPPAKSQEKASTVAEISRAPSPISPLRGANAPIATKIDAKGEFYGTYEEYKAARKAGKIK